MEERKSIMELLKQAETKIYMSDLPEGRYTAKYRGIKEVPEDKVNGIRAFSVLLFDVEYQGSHVEVTDFLSHNDIPEADQLDKLGQKMSRIQKAVFGTLNLKPFEVHKALLEQGNLNIWLVKSLDEKGIAHTNVRYSAPQQKTALEFLRKENA